ncbi:hypothetical protein [Pseudomonas sp. Pseusp97]|uniref:hypothetical protein n=1 Tax=Pseudomonas sp. Pseusp97 TaxID=3243065 RepID=UPI0039A6C01F
MALAVAMAEFKKIAGDGENARAMRLQPLKDALVGLTSDSRVSEKSDSLVYPCVHVLTREAIGRCWT